MNSDSLLDSTAKLGLLIGRVKKKMHKRMSDLLKPYELTPEQRAILLTLSAKGPMSQAQICNHMSTEPSNLSTTLKRLLHKDYITRIDHPNDPRAYLIEASQKANLIIKELSNLSVFIDERLTQGIDLQALNTTFTTLETIDKNLESISNDTFNCPSLKSF